MPLSPMMKQFLEIKEQYKDCILFYRLGDFYEMFFEDAVEISRELDLTLTGRDCGQEKRAPMCGVPYHAAEAYIKKLIDKNYKVAICEQLSEPVKGRMVERAVVKVITPGTVFSDAMLDEKSNNFIASVYYDEKCGGAVAWADISTGEFYVSEAGAPGASKAIVCENLNNILAGIAPSEIIGNSQAKTLNGALTAIKQGDIPKIYENADFNYTQSAASDLIQKQFGDCQNAAINSCAALAMGSLLNYLIQTQKTALLHLTKFSVMSQSRYMSIDATCRKHLEIIESVKGGKYGSLLWALDYTKNSMGARLLKKWVNEPLYNKVEIERRLNAVEELYANKIGLDRVGETLSKINDIERIVSKLSVNSNGGTASAQNGAGSGAFNPRNALALKESLAQLPSFLKALQPYKSPLINEIVCNVCDFSKVVELLEKAIREDAAVLTKDGGYIKPSFNKQLAEYTAALTDGRKWMAALEANEREKTGIKNLRVGYNNVFGYYIEITNSQKHLAPYNYVRKQTITNAERFITEELKSLEDKILHAEENAIKLEAVIFNEIKTELARFMEQFKGAAAAVAQIDALASLAKAAENNNYKKPTINDGKKGLIEIKNGRHPIVEQFIKLENFTPNDVLLDNSENTMILLTGPNMSGKSTYMRQIALICIMAHIGSFVPADSADISLVDKVFTRIGASDDLSSGQSTFMVEMREVAAIVNQATDKSLIILDEVGRGTSTFDGISIAHAVLQYISQNIKAKTLFATHYHELIALEETLPNLKNYSISVKEFEDSVLFLHKIVRGGVNRSFGIEVARLAGINNQILNQAKANLKLLEAGKHLSDLTEKNQNIKFSEPVKNLKTQTEADVLAAIKNSDLNSLSPLMCMDLLNKLKNKLN